MNNFFSVTKSFAVLIIFILIAGFTAGVTWGVIGRVFRLGAGLVS